jgi:hypothetical protein
MHVGDIYLLGRVGVERVSVHKLKSRFIVSGKDIKDMMVIYRVSDGNSD